MKFQPPIPEPDSSAMQAAVYTAYGPPEVLGIETVARPVPGDNDILVRVRAAAVNATDVIFRRGRPLIARATVGFFKPKKKIPGEVFSGVVAAVGRKVRRFKTGDAVFGSAGEEFGAYAQYKCLPEDGVLAPKPANMSHAEAAAVCDGSLTALFFLRNKAALGPGRKILINGASGSNGTAAVQLAKHFAAHVTGVCSSANVDLVASLGADRVIDYTREEIRHDGNAYDTVFDAVGKCSFSRCRKVLTSDGIYLTTVLTPAIVLQAIWTSRFSRQKAAIAFAGLQPAGERTKDLHLIRDLIEAGRLKAVIDRRYPLEQIAEAHRYVEKGHKKGSVVLILEKARISN